MPNPAPLHQFDRSELPLGRTKGPAWRSTAGAPAGQSRVADMQRELEQRLVTPSEKWSPRKTLAFVVGTCGTFWALVAVAVLAH